jgi:hypothetical protein
MVELATNTITLSYNTKAQLMAVERTVPRNNYRGRISTDKPIADSHSVSEPRQHLLQLEASLPSQIFLSQSLTCLLLMTQANSHMY